MSLRAATIVSWVALLAGVALGCGGEGDETKPPHDVGQPACEAPDVALPDGSCIRPGVPPDGCGEGFVHDGEYGCEPLLPPEPCPFGLMAVPGETECHSVMPCGDGRWGELAVDASTVYVDAAYTGGGSDGSDAQPFTTIGAAVAAAAPGALIAVADGRYVEDVVIEGKPVRLWGRCPERVEIAGTGFEGAALVVKKLAHGSEVGGFALGGPAMGVLLIGSLDVVLERLWVRDSGGEGIALQPPFGATSAHLSRSLIERNHSEGLFVMGSDLTVDSSVVRATLPRASDQARGRGIGIQPTCTTNGCDPGARSEVMVRRSLVEQNHDIGILVSGSDATIESTVVRTTSPRASDLTFGRGISVQLVCTPNGCDGATRSIVTVRGSVVEQNHDQGLLVSGSDATVESTVVRATLPQASDQTAGRGVSIQIACIPGFCDATARSTATVRGSLVKQNHDIGLYVVGSDATVQSTVVRATSPQVSDGLYGDGVVVFSDLAAANATLSALLVDDSARAGVASFGGAVSMSTTQIRCAAFALSGEHHDERSFSFEDGGQNACGCPAADDLCKAVSAGLEPPKVLGSD